MQQNLFRYSQGLSKLPPYLMEEVARAKDCLVAQGYDLIDLGVGDPDGATYPHIVSSLKEAVDEPRTHHYAPGRGSLPLRQAFADWFERRYQVNLDPEAEVLALLGTKEGIGHIHLAFVDPGDTVLIPDPGYPTYTSGTFLSGGEPLYYPLRSENHFLPDFSEIEQMDLSRARILHINYPHNPTAAVADLKVFKEAAAFSSQYGLILCQDAAYNEITYDGFLAPSLLQVPEGKAVGVEFHSLSKTFNMPGWRVGFAVGNPRILSGLAMVKSHLDTGMFMAIQQAACAALTGSARGPDQAIETYRKRRDRMVEGLRRRGFRVEKPLGTFYLWVPIPERTTSLAFAKRLLEEAHIVVTPGEGFGQYGQGYIRMALTVPEDRIEEGLRRLERLTF